MMKTKQILSAAILALTLTTLSVSANESCLPIEDNKNAIITLEANGGVLDCTEYVTQHGKAKLPIPVRSSDYQFEGWFTEDGTEITNEFIYDSDTALYAHWSVIGAYTLYFSSDGGSYVRSVTAPFETTISLEQIVPKKAGFVFEGWYSDARNKQERVTEFTFNEDEVLYARWRDDGTIKPKLPVQKHRSNEEIMQYGNHIDEKTGAPVTALWVQQQEKLKELMEIHNSIYQQ